APSIGSLRRYGSRGHRGVWLRSAAGPPGSQPGSPRGDPAAVVGSVRAFAVRWVSAWAWSFPLQQMDLETTIINEPVGGEKPRSRVTILLDPPPRSQELARPHRYSPPENGTPLNSDEKPLPKVCRLSLRQRAPLGRA